MDQPQNHTGDTALSSFSQTDHFRPSIAAGTNETGSSQEPFAVSRGLLARYNREELYEKVWAKPLQVVAKEYGVSGNTIGQTCKELHVPVPGSSYWNKKRANRPLPAKPRLPEVLGLLGPAVPKGTFAGRNPFVVPRRLLARYNREELYEKVWAMPRRKVAEGYGVSKGTIGNVCKRLQIPVPPLGYWAKKAFDKPVPARLPLPEFPGLIRRTDLAECSQTVDGPLDHAGNKDLVGPSPQHDTGGECAAEIGGMGTSQEPFAVSSILLARYNREEIYEKVWTMSVRKVAEEHGVSHSVMGKACKGLHIPVPPIGYPRLRPLAFRATWNVCGDNVCCIV